MKCTISQILAMVVTGLSCTLGAGDTWYVTVAGGGSGTIGWSDACTLAEALAGAQSGDELWVKQGTYIPDPNSTYCVSCPTLTSRHATFRILPGQRLYGGFRGPDNSDPNNPFPGESSLQQRDEVAYPTILDGDIGVPNDATDDVYHVVTAHNVGLGTKISGFTIRRGNANSSDPNDIYERIGGGMLVVSTSGQSAIDITRCVFDENKAYTGGGGLAVEWQSNPSEADPVRIVSCTFDQNTADSLDPNQPDGTGGGVRMRQVAFELTNSVFTVNTSHYDWLRRASTFAKKPGTVADRVSLLA